ncbi:hypothetical protein ACFRIB_19460 [Streptomyces mirabilis]|uniref:hypothetical protein n=1 Tax=Streptomyces mirabilis TaxID=68239 RepID=UPI0036A5BB5F
MNAFGVSTIDPPILVALNRIVFASRTPPFEYFHSSVWSSDAKHAGSPLTLVADDVIGLISPRGR